MSARAQAVVVSIAQQYVSARARQDAMAEAEAQASKAKAAREEEKKRQLIVERGVGDGVDDLTVLLARASGAIERPSSPLHVHVGAPTRAGASLATATEEETRHRDDTRSEQTVAGLGSAGSPPRQDGRRSESPTVGYPFRDGSSDGHPSGRHSHRSRWRPGVQLEYLQRRRKREQLGMSSMFDLAD